MASIIKIKRSLTASSVPSSLVEGELAANLEDKKLFIGGKNGGANVQTISGDQYNLTTSGNSSISFVTLTVDNDSLSNDAIGFIGGTGINVVRNANNTFTLNATGEATAASANTLTTARYINLSGDVSGNVLFDGSESVTISATVADDSHNHVISNVDGLQTALDGKATWTALTGTNTAIRALVSDRLQVANAAATYQTISVERAALANTNSYIASVAATELSHLANTNAYIANVKTIASNRLGETASVELTGAVTGTANFSSNSVSVSTTIADNSVALGTKTTGNYASAVTGTANEIDVTGTAGEGTSFQIGLANSVTITNSLTVGGSVQIDGDLQVTGNTVTVGTTNLSVSNNFIYLNDGGGNSNIDMGWAGGYNNGSYAHAGVFRDATDGRFKFFDQYTPEISEAVDINTAHASFALSQVQANNFIGDLTGTAELANTAVKLQTARSIGLTGDVSGSANFDGTSNITITATVADDSHNHVISNVDGLQTALDAKATWSALTGTNTAIRALVSDRLQVANAAATYQTISVERAALANTNAYIATKTTESTALARLANTNAYIGNVAATELSHLANTNAYIASVQSTERAALANTNARIATAETNIGQKLGATATVALTGAVTASATAFSGNTASLTTSIADNAVALGTKTTGNYVATISGTANEIEVTGSGSETASVTVGLPDNVTVGNNLTVSGNTAITGNLVVDGDLTVEGGVTYLSTSTVYTDDGMMKLSANNAGDTTDSGVYAKYIESATTKYAGYFRDATDGVFKFYEGNQSEPTSTVNTGGTGYALAQVDAVIDGGTY